MAERDEMDLFDFNLDDIVKSDKGQAKKGNTESKQDKPIGEINFEQEVMSSYLLVNTLLNLLISKGVIYPHEVNALLSDLYAEYKKRKKE